MLLACVSNDPRSLADHQLSRAAPYSSNFPLSVGSAYAVLGMLIHETIFHFLVRDDDYTPTFAPAGMFELWSGPIPSGWGFSLESGIRASGRDLWASPVVALWGYPELINDPSHMDALAERDPAALAIFHSRATAAGLSAHEPDNIG